MRFERATLQDLPELMKIMNEAIALLGSQQSPQWQKGYGPTTQKIQADIDTKSTYILRNETNEITGTVALIEGVDPAYTAIEEGQWLDLQDAPYIALHRLAINQKFRGQKIAKQLIEAAIEEVQRRQVRDVRIDTHELNKGMQKAIQETGFSYQGIVFFPIPDGKRLAYQKIV